MKYSFIIPTFNEATVIARSLKQFQGRRQKGEIEVIVADGGSTDGTLELAAKYTDKIARKPNSRPETIARGRNRGAALASGKILIFLDADVLVSDLSRLLRAIDQAFADEKVVAATAKSEIYPEDRRWEDKVFFFFFWNYVKFLNAVGRGAAKGECQIMRREAFDRLGGYNDRLGAAEDFELYSRLAKIGKIACLNNVSVYESPRRYRKVGYWRLMYQWSVNYFRAASGKSIKKWSTIR